MSATTSNAPISHVPAVVAPSHWNAVVYKVGSGGNAAHSGAVVNTRSNLNSTPSLDMHPGAASPLTVVTTVVGPLIHVQSSAVSGTHAGPGPGPMVYHNKLPSTMYHAPSHLPPSAALSASGGQAGAVTTIFTSHPHPSPSCNQYPVNTNSAPSVNASFVSSAVSTTPAPSVTYRKGSTSVLISGSQIPATFGQQRISVFEPYPMRDAVQHFCEKHLDKIKAYMQKIFVTLPLPVRCTIEGKIVPPL